MAKLMLLLSLFAVAVLAQAAGLSLPGAADRGQVAELADRQWGLTCLSGRDSCVTKCQSQNCATGYCDYLGGAWGGICRCSRCSNGVGK